MLNLDPGKLLVIGVVAIILLGPDRLPQVARQIGGAWRTFNEFRHRMESEVRNTMPDLPADLGDRPAGPFALRVAQPPVEHGVGRGARRVLPTTRPAVRERQRGRRGGHARDRPRRRVQADAEPPRDMAAPSPARPVPAPPPAPAPIHVERPTRAPKPSGVVVPGDPTLN